MVDRLLSENQDSFCVRVANLDETLQLLLVALNRQHGIELAHVVAVAPDDAAGMFLNLASDANVDDLADIGDAAAKVSLGNVPEDLKHENNFLLELLSRQHQQQRARLQAKIVSPVQLKAALVALKHHYVVELAKVMVSQKDMKENKRKVDAWLYDIACQFRPFARNLLSFLRENEPDSWLIPKLEALLTMPSAIGATHVLGHQLQCQVHLSARNVPGLGMTDGENNERFQSFLVRFRSRLKYASPHNFRLTLISPSGMHNIKCVTLVRY